jgi:enoyl-CoA hydratase
MADRYGFSTISCELAPDGVLSVLLNRPDARNALDTVMHHELTQLFARLHMDSEVKVVFFSSNGNDFTIGADFNVMESNNDGGYPDGHPGLMVESALIIHNMIAVRQPIVAAIKGYALGIGATLALFSDIVFMDDNGKIGDPHVKAGMVAGDGGAVIWPLLVGVHRAKEFLLTGNLMKAVDAERLGLINYALPVEEMMSKAMEMARSLAAGPSVAIQFNKRLVNKHVEAALGQVMDLSLALEALSIETSDHREAVSAFLGKRKPNFGSGGK